MKKWEIVLHSLLRTLLISLLVLLIVGFFYCLYLGMKDSIIFANKNPVNSPSMEELIINKTLQKVEDTNFTYYNSSAIAIAGFIEKYSSTKESVDPHKSIEYVKELSEKYEDKNLVSLFAKEYSELISRVLQNQNIIELTKSEDPYTIVEKITNTFTKEFEKKYIHPKSLEVFDRLAIQPEAQIYLTFSLKALEYIVILIGFLLLLRIYSRIGKGG